MSNVVAVVTETWATNDDYRQGVKISFNGEELFSMVDGEPEDNTLARNFSFDLAELVNLVALAAMDGKVVQYERKEVSWDEFFEG